MVFGHKTLDIYVHYLVLVLDKLSIRSRNVTMLLHPHVRAIPGPIYIKVWTCWIMFVFSSHCVTTETFQLSTPFAGSSNIWHQLSYLSLCKSKKNTMDYKVPLSKLHC